MIVQPRGESAYAVRDREDVGEPLDAFAERPKFMRMPPDDSVALRAQLQALFGSELTIERELGRGGMAAVFAATDHALQRRVAVKMLLPEFADDPTVSDRFVREGRTVASLQHPHIVSAYGVRSANGTNAIVMQLVDGRSLDVVLAEQGAIPLPAAGLILSQVAAALQHAHDRGVVHRDVKPANVLIDQDGRAVVSDFGIARRNDGAAVTKTGVVLGTWDYMSPEQRAGERVTTATDQYALGVMAFELFAGVLPFTGTLQETMKAHMLDAPPSLCALRPELTPEIEALVQRLMAKAPEERLPSLALAERVFENLAPNRSSITRQLAGYSRTVTRVETPVVIPAIGTPVSSASVPASRDRVVVAAVIAMVLVIAGVVGWLVVGRRTASVVSPPIQSAAEAVPGAAPKPPELPARSPRGVINAKSLSSERTPASAPASAPAESALSPAVGAPGASAAVLAEVASKSSNAPTMTATLADARQIGRAFLTMLNQRRARDVALLPMIAGDANARADLLKLTESAPEFAAGYDRLPSSPAPWNRGFETDLYLDLEWRGGKRTTHVHLFAVPADDGWRLAGISVDPAP